MQLGRVFISSVFGGMLDLRESAARAARLVGLEPVLTERQVAQPGSVREALGREIAACDTYVGLFDRRRGTVPKGSDEDHPRAITEEELALARERGLRCLVFLSRAAATDREPGLNEFLDAKVTDYRAGLWTRPYDDPTALRREIAAGLAALQPRAVLALAPGAEGLAATLFLDGVAPAWGGETVLGPVPVRLDLSPASRQILTFFRRGTDSRNQIKEDALRFLGHELGAVALPGRLGEALSAVLALAAHSGRLVTLDIRTADPAALALPWELLSLPGHPLPVHAGLVEIVRRIPGPGEPADPAQDTAATVPAAHLSILGFTAAPVEDEAVEARLGTGGLGASELFWEREQEQLLAALEDLLRERAAAGESEPGPGASCRIMGTLLPDQSRRLSCLMRPALRPTTRRDRSFARSGDPPNLPARLSVARDDRRGQRDGRGDPEARTTGRFLTGNEVPEGLGRQAGRPNGPGDQSPRPRPQADAWVEKRPTTAA